MAKFNLIFRKTIKSNLVSWTPIKGKFVKRLKVEYITLTVNIDKRSWIN